MQLEDHVSKRETRTGKWMPVAFYVANLVLWMATGIQAAAWAVLWLIALTLPPLVLYMLRVFRRVE